MLLRISMRDEDIRSINYLRSRSEQALRESDENGDREESEMARAVELLNRIFYGCINQEMMEMEREMASKETYADSNQTMKKQAFNAIERYGVPKSLYVDRHSSSN